MQKGRCLIAEVRDMYSVFPLCGKFQKTRSVFGVLLFFLLLLTAAHAEQLTAGTAKVDITDYDTGPVSDPLFVKALLLKSDTETLALITVDAVAVAEIGRIGSDYIPVVRAQLEQALGIPPAKVLFSASHCHGAVCGDVAERTVQAVTEASRQLVPVRIGAGSGHEDRIMENRRFRLHSGAEADSRHAYSLPPDEAIAGIGPVDPEIGVLRLDRYDGRTLAVVYNFACHPILGVPGYANTADLTGFASKVIEEELGGGAVALFLQGCAGDINPAFYKDTDHPRNAEIPGTLLGLGTLRAIRGIPCGDDTRFVVLNESLELPRADHAPRIASLEHEQDRLLHSLKGTSLNLKTFLPLAVKYGLSPEYTVTCTKMPWAKTT